MLSARQKADWARDGYLVLPGFVDRADCDQLKAHVGELLETTEADPATLSVFDASSQSHAQDDYFLNSGDTISMFLEDGAVEDGALTRPLPLAINKLGHAMHDLDPEFDRFSRTPELAELVSDLGFVDPLLLQSMYIFKQPGIGGEVNCHCDHTFLWTDPQSAIGLWFAIEDATVDNGCLWAIPGGHHIEAKGRFRRKGPGTVMEVLDETPYPIDDLVPLPVDAGSLIVLHGTLPHWSAPNRSERSRHAYTLHIIEGEADYPDDNWLQRPNLPLRGFSTI